MMQDNENFFPNEKVKSDMTEVQQEQQQKVDQMFNEYYRNFDNQSSENMEEFIQKLQQENDNKYK
eukprot:CAMPEP_0116939188 /NCGR_PEP_ID=MMETSP0467-20121206/32586_1 /TAXON_ID=283647 /ORGANISM="Mesodinium pulex, Strain SPMC105" /LENGTH=64 /DNA_ID=CAMNT_0004621417 /DNA_START=692 /DNA_END=886 /DNA_ORIENTATION=-